MRMAGIEDTADMLEKQLASELSKMTLEEALSLARAFSHSLNLMGIAETHHRLVGFQFTYFLFICLKPKNNKRKEILGFVLVNLRSCCETN